MIKQKKPELGITKQNAIANKPALGGRLKPGEQAPNFESLFGAPPAERIRNPLPDLAATDDPEEAAENEVSAALQHILDEKKQKRDAYRTMLDHEFWCAICFQNREQKEAFLKAIGILDLGDKYIDGLKVAQRLGVEVEPVNLPMKDVRAAPKLLRDNIM